MKQKDSQQAIEMSFEKSQNANFKIQIEADTSQSNPAQFLGQQSSLEQQQSVSLDAKRSDLVPSSIQEIEYQQVQMGGRQRLSSLYPEISPQKPPCHETMLTTDR